MDMKLPLDDMTICEKLKALEEIWDNLCADQESVPSPPWHEDILHAREQRAHEDPSRFVDWEHAKRAIRE